VINRTKDGGRNEQNKRPIFYTTNDVNGKTSFKDSPYQEVEK
jgi:hypothetical protein